MGSKYSEVIRRLREYRQRLSRTQEEMAEYMGVTQSHYSKLEQGNTVISYDSLERFYRRGGDVNYLITGIAHRESELNRLLGSCVSAGERTELFKVIVWSVNQGLIMNRTPIDLSVRYRKLIRFMDDGADGKPVWERIRRNEELSQIDMAEKLDINVKRYRRLERQDVEADAEILNVLYETWGYSPMVVLSEDAFYLDELNVMWNALSEGVRKELRDFLDHAVRLMEETAGDPKAGRK